ncbi:hypothetical protein HON36_05000 [Candidatus Parcubacteria bacterium]|jgi:TRAP-type C4-dicarboxylate transport system permease small subunit|nr:hypothetical protein [Candidatus Parcubacteria bacterium]MBT7228389.1 hypothetical protein [Candidatus Parcubacteria bacterium]
MRKLVTGLLLVMPMMASAQTTEEWGIDDLDQVNLGTRSLRDTIAGVINIVLGFLGILATVIILLGGFKWMTSQGSTDKVDEAKKLIGAGVVGLVIILTAYAVSRFVLESLANETV